MRDLVAVHIGRLGAGGDLHTLADAPGEAGLRLDIGMLDIAGLEAPLGARRGIGEARLQIAAGDAALDQHIAGTARMQLRCSPGQRGRGAHQRRQFLPVDGNFRLVHRLQRRAIADQRQHRLAAEAHIPVRQHRLVLQVGIDAETVAARHVTGGEDALDAGVVFPEGIQIAQREAGMGMGRADRTQP